MAFDDDLIACAKTVERGDPDRFRTVMAAPLSAREVLFPLYAFNVEVARAPWLTQEPMIAEMRLQWWRDALDEIVQGGPFRRHEVTTPLARLLTPEDAARLDRLIAARRWDIYRDAFDDQDHFDRYIDDTSGHLVWTAARLLGARDEAAVRDAAWAIGVAGFLRAIPQLAAAGRVPLIDGTEDGVRTLAKRALDRLRTARRADIARPAHPALWPAIEVGRTLAAAAASPQRVRDGQLPAPSRLGLALRAALGRW